MLKYWCFQYKGLDEASLLFLETKESIGFDNIKYDFFHYSFYTTNGCFVNIEHMMIMELLA